MTLLHSDIIKIDILKALNQEKCELSMNLLRKKVGLVNYNSLIRNCEFLELFGFINIEVKTIEDRSYYYVSITKSGIEQLNKIKRVNYG